MSAVEARLSTSRADRYLTQLASHMAHGPGGLTVLSTSAEELVVDLGTATWSVRAAPEELVLRLDADDADDADELEQQSARVANRVEQIARRDGLRVTWSPAP